MAKKSFTQTATAAFISTETEAPKEPAKATPAPKKKPVKASKPASDPKPFEVPAGQRLAPELKNERMQLLISTRLKEGIRKAADAKGVSMNDLINSIVSDYLEKEGGK